MAPRWLDRIAPRIDDARRTKLAVSTGFPGRAANPPSTQPTSPLTQPISVTSAIEFFTNTQVDLKTLMAIPAFRRAITLVCGTAGSFPYHAINGNGEQVPTRLLSQPENGKGLTRDVSMTQLAMDLYVYGSALWLVKDSDRTTGFPTSVERVPYGQWDQDDETGAVIIAGEKQPPAKVRLFVSPFAGLAFSAAPTVRVYAALQKLSLLYAANPQAREYLKGAEGLDLTADKIEELLADFMDKRKTNVTAYVPPELDVKEITLLTPEQMLMVSAQQFIISEVSRLTGIDGFWLGVGQESGMVYSNRVDLRQDFVDFVLMPTLVKPIEERLSLNDCLPNGQFCRANLDAWLRPSTKERYETYLLAAQIAQITGVPPVTSDEMRSLENRPLIKPTPHPPSEATQ